MWYTKIVVKHTKPTTSLFLSIVIQWRTWERKGDGSEDGEEIAEGR